MACADKYASLLQSGILSQFTELPVVNLDEIFLSTAVNLAALSESSILIVVTPTSFEPS